jgi:hypothetical protein
MILDIEKERQTYFFKIIKYTLGVKDNVLKGLNV